jgi:hypothetical protein
VCELQRHGLFHPCRSIIHDSTRKCKHYFARKTRILHGFFSKSPGRDDTLPGLDSLVYSFASVGVSFGLTGSGWSAIWPVGVAVFVFTALAVLAGMLSGSAAGTRFGTPVRIVGGIILIALGVHILF